MAYWKNPDTKGYEADVKDRAMGRVHLSLKTSNAREAGRRHAALEALVRAGRADVLDRLRGRKLNIEAVTECHERQRAWDTLLARDAWPTLDIAVAEFLAWIDAHPSRSEGTHRMVSSRLLATAKLLGGDRRVDEITTVDVDGEADAPGLRQKLRETGVGDATLGNYLIALGGLYRWLRLREAKRAREAKRPARELDTPVDRELIPRGTTKRARFLEPREAGDVLLAAPVAYRAAVGAGLFAGLRIDEVVHLRPEDIDLDLGILYIQTKPSPLRKNGIWKPKSKHSLREIPIDPSLAQLFAVHLADHGNAAWCFPSSRHPEKPLDPTGMWRVAHRIVEDAGLVPWAKEPQGVTFHTLRHTFASWLVMEGVDLFTVSQLLGHRDITEVQATYAHLSPDHRARAIAKLARRFSLPTLDTPDAGDSAPSMHLMSLVESQETP